MSLPFSETAPQRFWAKVERGADDACWMWTAHRDKDGYGSFRAGGKQPHMRAHRAAWMLTNGEIPDGLFVLHNCDTPGCVNPTHLFLGTNTDNMQDMHAKRRGRYGSDHHFSRPEFHRALPYDSQVRGERDANARLTADAVRAMRAQHATGIGTRRLAKAFGVCQRTAYLVVTRQTWKHVV